MFNDAAGTTAWTNTALAKITLTNGVSTFAVLDNYATPGVYAVYLRAITKGEKSAIKQININHGTNCDDVATLVTTLDKN